MLTQERIKELLDYSKETGKFIWKVQRQCVKQGTIAGSLSKLGYIKIVIDGKSYLAHRLAFLYETGSFPVNFVDHINGVTFDNRWYNLRNATRSENIQNSITAPRGLPRNVFFYGEKKNPYRVVIYHHGKSHSYGYFSSLEDASNTATEIRKKLHGEFAVENRANRE